MSRTEKKTEIGELRSLLRSNDVQRDPRVYEQVVQKVIAYMTLGIDVSSLCTEMIMAGASQSIVQKKLVYLYLSTYAQQNSEFALLTVNTLRKDATDRNPTVRGLALRALTSLRASNVVEYVVEAIQTGIDDKSAYVRKTAVMGVVKLHYVAPETVADLNFVDILYQMLRDKDAQVISNCISALEEILAEEGGMVLTKKITHYLINRLRDFSEWSQCQILQLLLRYQCQDEEEVYDILNVIDDRLKHVVSGVVLATIRLFFHFTETVPSIHEDILERIKTPLLSVIGSSSPEVTYTCLQHIELLQFRNPVLFDNEYHNFFCRYNDPPYVKLKKLHLLTQVANEVNATNVIEELGECTTDINPNVAIVAIQSVGVIAIKVSGQANHCIDTLLSLLSLEIDHITSEIIITMMNILRRYEDIHEKVLPRLINCYSIMTKPKGKAALIWILGEYGESLPEVPYILEEIIDNIKEEASSEVKLQLLTAVVKTFFKRPPECQEMLGRLLEYVIEEETDMLVRDRGLLYYRLLKSDVSAAKRVVCGSQKILSHLISPPKAAQMFSQFNSLAIVYGQSPTEFIDPSPPYTIASLPDIDQTGKKSNINLDELFVESPTSNESSASDLIEMYSSGESKVPYILLNPKPTMTAEEFEKQWITMTSSKEQVFDLSVVPKLKEIQTRLSKRSVKTLAASPDGLEEVKLFLYAQHVSTFDFFLVEVIMTSSIRKIKMTVKTDKPQLTDQFLLHIIDTIKACLSLKQT